MNISCLLEKGESKCILRFYAGWDYIIGKAVFAIVARSEDLKAISGVAVSAKDAVRSDLKAISGRVVSVFDAARAATRITNGKKDGARYAELRLHQKLTKKRSE